VQIRREVGGSNAHELHGRVIRADNQTTLALDVDPIELELRAADGADVRVEALGCEGASLDAGLIRARVGDEFSLRFRLSSAHEQRVRVELFGASAKRRVDAAITQARFASLATLVPPRPTPSSTGPTPTASPAPPTAAPAWLAEFDDPGVRRSPAQTR
jgi:hypothetical protein